MERCELCGTPVKVVGNTTMHYEPDLPDREELVEIIEKEYREYYDDGSIKLKSCHIFSFADKILERLKGEK